MTVSSPCRQHQEQSLKRSNKSPSLIQDMHWWLEWSLADVLSWKTIMRYIFLYMCFPMATINDQCTPTDNLLMKILLRYMHMLQYFSNKLHCCLYYGPERRTTNCAGNHTEENPFFCWGLTLERLQNYTLCLLSSMIFSANSTPLTTRHRHQSGLP